MKGTDMTVLTPGHKYGLPNFENPGGVGQTIQFIEKKLKAGGQPGELATVNDGTTNEALLKVLIDRLRFLGNKFPCRQNAIAITKCEEALMWLEIRTAERMARGVEGKHLA